MTAPMRAKIAYQGSAKGASARSASRMSELNDMKWLSLVVAKWTEAA